MNGQAPAISPRTNEIETHGWSASIYNPVQIHLQYLPDVVPLARAWNHTGLSDGGEPQAGSTCALQDFSTSPAHHWK